MQYWRFCKMKMIHDLFKVQADIKVELIKSVGEDVAHRLAQELCHIFFISEVIKPEHKEVYESTL